MKFPFSVPVAGVSFYQPVVKQINTGTRLLLIRQPDNPYDTKAIAVVRESDNSLLGYIPKAVIPRFSFAPLPLPVLAGQIREGKIRGFDVLIQGPQTVLAIPTTSTFTKSTVSGQRSGTSLEKIQPQLNFKIPPKMKVYSHSGRLLGFLVKEASGISTICTPSGEISIYATSVLRVIK